MSRSLKIDVEIRLSGFALTESWIHIIKYVLSICVLSIFEGESPGQ